MTRVWHLLFSTTIVQTKRKEFILSVIFNSEKNNRWIPGKQLDRRAPIQKSKDEPALHFKQVYPGITTSFSLSPDL